MKAQSTFASRKSPLTSYNFLTISIIFFVLGYVVRLKNRSFTYGGYHDPIRKSSISKESGASYAKAFILKESISTLRYQQKPDVQTEDHRERLKVFIGIFTVPASSDSEYGQRRAAIRQTWLPLLLDMPGVRAQWVVGQSTNRTLNKAMKREARSQPKNFMFLSGEECYECLPEKTKEFFTRVYSEYDADWIIKIDDDVYLAPTRLPIILRQWTDLGVDYAGCMKRGEVITEVPEKWAEPAWPLLAERYSLHAFGSTYALSRRAADIISRNAPLLRRMASEDVNMGIWMLAFNMTFFPDARMCTQSCHPDGVAFSNTYHHYCGGLCHPVRDIFSFHRQFMCRSLRPSLRFLHGFHNGAIAQQMLNTSLIPPDSAYLSHLSPSRLLSRHAASAP